MNTHPLALSPLQRGLLFAQGALGFQPAPERPHRERPKPPGRTPGTKNSMAHGTVKNLAQRVVAGEFGGLRLSEVADRHGVGYESLKAAEWKLRKEVSRD